MITITPHDSTYVKVRCDDFGIEQELVEHFTFNVPGAKFTPKFKSGLWDGKIRLFNQRTKLVYRGLVDLLFKFSRSRGYEISIDRDLNPHIDIKLDFVENYMLGLNLHGRGSPIDIRQYQVDAVHKALSNKRLILESATSSGKSLIIYSIIRYALEKNKKILLIVPTVGLVNQMVDDFKDYSSANGWDISSNVQSLYAGQSRVFDKDVVVSTWQTIASMKKSDPDNYEKLASRTNTMIADEVHTLKAAVVSSTIEGFTSTDHRIGTTGTMDETMCNALVLIGLVGQVYKIISAADLIKAGQAVPVEIKVHLLRHPEHFRKALKGMDYKEELSQIISNVARNEYLTDLAIASSGNTLLLYRFVENHGKILYEMIKAKAGNRPVYFIHGGVKVEERDRIRNVLDTDEDAIIVATESLMSTGINIPSIENLIFACPSKSTIRIRQSIGRTLRLKKGKTKAIIHDIADDYRVGSKKNITFVHMEERLGIYIKEEFEYTVNQLDLEY